MTESSEEFAWLDTVQAPFTGLEQRADIMRPQAQDGKDRIWWTDGEYLWFRRSKSNPATLERHNRFMADGDYVYIETQNDIEIYQLQPKSQFQSEKQTLDIGQMNNYNIRRQAALAACRRDWQAFHDIMTFLRERINATHGANLAGAEMDYAEKYMAVMESINQRDGPSPGEINRELMSLMQKDPINRKRMITIGGDKRDRRLRLA